MPSGCRSVSGAAPHPTTAAESANALGARAFTVDQDVVFAAGEYRPGDPGGRALITHELAHTVQQARGGPAPAGTDRTERAAAAASAAGARGTAPAPVLEGSAGQRRRSRIPSASGATCRSANSRGGGRFGLAAAQAVQGGRDRFLRGSGPPDPGPEVEGRHPRRGRGPGQERQPGELRRGGGGRLRRRQPPIAVFTEGVGNAATRIAGEIGRVCPVLGSAGR
ncbi:eCIS core domain-containing protein [Streptomyces goshikiensis]|uniref:eCIS core domain-containing protein n=1 Tax=Streptomyces goshikiensis TaxID=1942 RepID=UPI003673AAE3